MLDFYKAVRNADPNHQNIAVTVLEGEAFGEKALLSEHSIVWQSEASVFFERNSREWERLDAGGLYTIDGRRVFCELLGQERKIVICGGGHVSIPIVRMGLMIGCHVTVLEDRPSFADHARLAGAQRVICDSFEHGLAQVEGDKDTFFVIVTRGHRHDQTCLERIVRKEHAYIGMIGSRTRVGLVKQAILEGGADPEVVAQVYAPVGLDIGAETPEEIAVSVIAQIIDVKNKKKRNTGYSKAMLDRILGSGDLEQAEEPKVIATIVMRKGSAPRETGTKMLIFQDGTCFDTIGGGCAESEILRIALAMLHSGNTSPRLCHVDMTRENTEEEGMVCGGTMDVLLEVIAGERNEEEDKRSEDFKASASGRLRI